MMNEDELRDFAIAALNPRTERDAQREVGASNLSNPCQRCTAFEMQGVERTSGILDGAWGGRVIGTAIHGHIQKNLQTAAETANEVGDDLAQIGWRYPGLQVERKLTLGELTPGRPIGSTTDVHIPSRFIVGDWKNTDLRKLAYLRDAIAMMRGGEALFGRDSDYVVIYEQGVVKTGAKAGETVYRKATKGVSERVYADEIDAARVKFERHVKQLHLYGMGLVNAGEMVKQLFVGYIARDSAMTVDNRESARYLEEAAPRGVVVVAMPYNHEYAVGLWKNAQAMAKALEEGKKEPMDYPPHQTCLVCNDEATREARATVTVEVGAAVDPWAAMAEKAAA